MDGGSGLLERLCINVPDSRIPLPLKQEECKRKLANQQIQSVAPFFTFLLGIEEDIRFYLDEDAQA